jgi:hypothetical protein
MVCGEGAEKIVSPAGDVNCRFEEKHSSIRPHEDEEEQEENYLCPVTFTFAFLHFFVILCAASWMDCFPQCYSLRLNR